MKGIYIHIPFCAQKCEYCDFVSLAGAEDKRDAYLDALEAEMALYRGETADTVFIGGGTPSILTPEQISRLCRAVADNFNIAPDCEWTSEANPGTLTAAKLRAMRNGGINRLSIGVQSFNDRELRAAGRIHDAKTAYEAVTAAAAGGFGNISIDLMASLPYQTEESFKRSLETAVSLPLRHISVYSLIIEDGTPIKAKYDSGEYAMPDEETDRRMYHFTRKFLAEQGFSRYEISNYAVPGYESRHNLKYWDCGEYIGVGVAAASYYGGRRYSNTRSLDRYIKGNFRSGDEEILTAQDMRGEFMMLGLRKTAGVSETEFRRRFGIDMRGAYAGQIEKFTKLGLAELKDGMFRLTENGLDVANSVMCEFI